MIRWRLTLHSALGRWRYALRWSRMLMLDFARRDGFLGHRQNAADADLLWADFW